MAPQSLTGSKGLEGQAAGVRMGHLPGSSLSPNIRNGSLLGRGSADPPISQPGEPWRTSCGPSGGRAGPPPIVTKDGCLSQPPDDFVAGRAMHRQPTRGSLCYVFPFHPFFFPPQMLITLFLCASIRVAEVVAHHQLYHHLLAAAFHSQRVRVTSWVPRRSPPSKGLR